MRCTARSVAHGGGNFPCRQAVIARDTEQHLRVIGEKRPMRHGSHLHSVVQFGTPTGDGDFTTSVAL